MAKLAFFPALLLLLAALLSIASGELTEASDGSEIDMNEEVEEAIIGETDPPDTAATTEEENDERDLQYRSSSDAVTVIVNNQDQNLVGYRATNAEFRTAGKGQSRQSSAGYTTRSSGSSRSGVYSGYGYSGSTGGGGFVGYSSSSSAGSAGSRNYVAYGTGGRGAGAYGDYVSYRSGSSYGAGDPVTVVVNNQDQVVGTLGGGGSYYQTSVGYGSSGTRGRGTYGEYAAYRSGTQGSDPVTVVVNNQDQVIGGLGGAYYGSSYRSTSGRGNINNNNAVYRDGVFVGYNNGRNSVSYSSTVGVGQNDWTTSSSSYYGSSSNRNRRSSGSIYDAFHDDDDKVGTSSNRNNNRRGRRSSTYSSSSSSFVSSGRGNWQQAQGKGF